MSALFYYYGHLSDEKTQSFFKRDTQALENLIAREELKLKIMQDQFFGAYTLFHLQQKLIDTLCNLLHFLKHPKAMIDDIHQHLRLITALSYEIEHELAKAQRHQRFGDEQQLVQIKLKQSVFVNSESRSRHELDEEENEDRPRSASKFRLRPRFY